MNSLKDRKEEIVNFWDIEAESDREWLIEELRKYFESKSEDELIPEIRENFEQINFSGISIIYEALSKNPDKWSDFFKDEYERAFEKATKSDNPFEILACLEEIGFVENNKLASKDEIIKLLETHLSNVKKAIRFKAIWYLGDWIDDDNRHQYKHIIQKIKKLLQDKNWKVRYGAKLFLEDMDGLPNDYRMSIIDQLKVRYLNPFKME